MDLHLYVSYGPQLLKGVMFTLYVCSGALVIGLGLGMLLCIIGRSGSRLLYVLYQLYITLFRGTPLLVQIYLVFYGGPFMGMEFSELQVGIGGLGLYSAAYFAEIFRSGFQSIPKGQIEAATDLGYSPSQTFFHVSMPQMFAGVLPTVVNQTILLVKESAILSVITVPEMTTAATRMSTETFSVVEPYLFLGVMYWLITFTLSRAARRVENRLTAYVTAS